MTDQKIQNFRCANKKCRKILCQTDGEQLFVGRLEVLPKIKPGKKGRYFLIACSCCGHATKWDKTKTDEDAKTKQKVCIFNLP